MYIYFIREFHELWTYWLTFFTIFLSSQHHSSSYLIVYIFCFIFYFFHHIFLCLEWWSFTFRCMENDHILLHSYLMDVSSEILNLEGHLVRESSPTSLFESISISLCILREVHLLIFKVCTSKRKKMQWQQQNDRRNDMNKEVWWKIKVRQQKNEEDESISLWLIRLPNKAYIQQRAPILV